MASSSADRKNLTEVTTTCSRCRNESTNPMSLECGHYFCQDCASHLEHQHEKDVEKVNCPLCKIFSTLVSDGSSKASFYMKGLAKALTNIDNFSPREKSAKPKLEKIIVCSQCERSLAGKCCVNCNIELCDNCSKNHLKLPICKEHQLVPLDHKERLITNDKCPDHPSYPLKLNCNDCRKLVCYECNFLLHKNHNVDTIEIATEKLLPKLEDHFDAILSKNSKLQSQKELLQKHLELVVAKYDEVERQIDEHSAALVNQLQQRQERLKAEVSSKKQSVLNEMSSVLHQLESSISQTGEIITWNESSHAQDKPSLALLHDLQHDILPLVDTVLTNDDGLSSMEKFIKENTVWPNFKMASTDPGSAIGTISFVNQKHKARDSEPKAVNIGNWGKEASLTIVDTSTTTTPTNLGFRQSNVYLKTMALNGVINVAKFKLERGHSFQRLCFHQDKFWIVCSKEKMYNSIDVYSLEGKLLQRVELTETGIVNALFPVNIDNLLLAAGNGVFVLDLNLNIISRIQSIAAARDVMVKDNIIAVLSLHSVHLNETLAPYSSVFTFRHHISVFPSSLILQEKHVFIAASDHKIRQYSLHGELLKEYGAKGYFQPGQLNSPYLCSVGIQGALLVADRMNARLQVLSSDGDWTVVKGVTALDALDTLIYNGYMYLCVSDGKSNN